jgi:histo-blood group ABO system transferase
MKSFLLFVFLFVTSAQAARIALCIMATGKYLSYAEQLIASARTHFCVGHEVLYFVFTDGTLQDTGGDIVRVEQKRLGWPYDTMMRFHAYYGAKELLQKMDYIFCSDADMLFVHKVGDEILSDLVATRHPGFYNKPRSQYTYETRKESHACINGDEGTWYVCGGFYGGTVKEILSYWERVIQDVDDDLKRGMIAVWHDESHWNRYCVDHRPTKLLSPSYCYPERWKLPFRKRLLALDKDHGALRK